MSTFGGACGIVTLRGNVAYKQFKYKTFFYRELFYLSILRHLRITKIYAANYNTLTIGMKRYDGTLDELASRLFSDKRHELAEVVINQLLPTIQAIHAMGIAHRDIKSNNI